jgi:cyclophilin family peptidyl-prolyl cis-trans isomerase
MANSGKNTNSSQFFVVLTHLDAQLAKLDGKYVLFGQLRDGWEVLDALDTIGGGADGKPTRPAWVSGCGIL